jgi:hypothetical protein
MPQDGTFLEDHLYVYNVEQARARVSGLGLLPRL